MNLLDFAGKFHPLVIHLPIGILSAFLIITLILPTKKLISSYSIIHLLLLLSALTATVSCITGYLLSLSGEYEGRLVTGHLTLGISLTVLNWGLFFKLKELLDSRVLVFRVTLIFLLIILIFTGHAGGSLTHGSDFLTPPSPEEWFSSESKPKKVISPNSTAYEAAALIFQDKCLVCHGQNKQKGKLRLDSREAILIGGENGELIKASASESLLMERLLLPTEDEDHMPPKEKKQLSQVEIDFLSWWIDRGLDFESSLEELNLPDSLSEIFTQEETVSVNLQIPNEPVAIPDESIIKTLKALNVIVIPIAENSNYVSVSFVNVLPEYLGVALKELAQIKPQLVWLNLDFQNPDPADWEMLSQLTNLRRLSAKDSNLDDAQIMPLSELNELVYINLVGTGISISGLSKLKNLSKLKSIYLFGTQIDPSNTELVMDIFPNSEIDFGNYVVPTLASDTTEFKL